MESNEETVSVARRAVVSRRLFFSHRIARPMFILAVVECFSTFIFAALPDDRSAESEDILAIYVLQSIFAWLNFILSLGCLALIFSTYSVTQRELTFDRQSRVGYLIIIKMGQLLIDIVRCCWWLLLLPLPLLAGCACCCSCCCSLRWLLAATAAAAAAVKAAWLLAGCSLRCLLRCPRFCWLLCFRATHTSCHQC